MGMSLGPLGLGLTSPLVGKWGGKSLYEQLTDPSKPMPWFVDLWRTDEFGFYMPLPTGSSLPTDSMSQKLLEYTVSGSEGDSTLTISAGDESKGTGNWPAVVQHDDGTYGVYVVSSLTGGSCTIFPNLRDDVTAGTLCNVGGLTNGQHLTEKALRAMAQKVYARDRRSCYRNRYAAKWLASAGAKGDWTAVNITSGQYSWANNRQQVLSASRAANAFAGRGRSSIMVSTTTPWTNKGVTKTFALGGKSGVLEIIAAGAALTAGFRAMRVLVTVDGNSVHDTTYTENDGLPRLLIDYPAGDVGVVQITAESGSTSTNVFVGDVTWWTYDRSMDWDAKVINKDAKIVVAGDSNFEYYNDAFADELQSIITADGGTGTVVSVAVSGTTAEDGLASFDSLVAPENPDQVISNYAINDRNTYADIPRWQKANYSFAMKCQNIGAEWIGVGPFPTSSFSQALGQGDWADQFGVGIPI